MFHESRKVSEVGSAREEGRVLKQNEKGVASLRSRTCVSRALGVHVLVRLTTDYFDPSTSLIMPKIKTSRTKKAPDGFEEIEPVGAVHYTVI